MIYTYEDGKFYEMGKELSIEEVLSLLDNYAYEKRRRTVHIHEQLIKTRAVNEHLKRENRLILMKLYRLAFTGPVREEEIDKELVAIDDDMIKHCEHLALENEELKKQIKLL